MSDPSKLRIEVVDVLDRAIPLASLKVVVRRGVEWREEKGELPAPALVDLQAGFIQIEIDAQAANFVAERGILNWLDPQWTTTNPAWALDASQDPPVLKVALGRIRFAPIVTLKEDLQVTSPFSPGGVLVTESGYRRHDLNPTDHYRTLKRPAIGKPDDPGWDRFLWEERRVDLAARGNWLVLEYGDFSGRLDAVRHLVGVWAPHKFPGARPPVVVQVTPNTRAPYYPIDRLPFTGLYPYGCVAKTDVKPDEKTGKVALRDCGQAYVELLSNRCFGQYKIVHQLYGARPDLFDGPNGPIVITPSPALTSNAGVLRDPFQHRDGLGRLIAEVLRFLWSRQLTLEALGAVRLRFRPPEVAIAGGTRPPAKPTGFPAAALVTVVCHSAGVAAVLALAGHAPAAAFPDKTFPALLFGGKNDYCDRDWRNLWVIDGVGTPGGIGVPSPGGPAVRIWLTWLRGEGRRMVLVYTPSGLGGQVAPELIRLTKPRRTGTTGWIEEGETNKVSWMQMSYSYLQTADPGKLPRVIPEFAPPKSEGDPDHNKVYELGVGYAARWR